MKSKIELIKDLQDNVAALTPGQTKAALSDASFSAIGLTVIMVLVDIRDVLNELLIEQRGRS
ncbi:MAG: hypothetical protein KAR43_05525 [Deltaproteobacteria bacterium]|nr:hypothetical protein [Deltaproteobacteria bacterium]